MAPVAVISVTYGRLARKLWRRKPIGELSITKRDADKRQQEKKRIVRMLIVIVILFALSWFPFFTYHVYTLFHHHSPHDTRYLIAQAFFELSGYSNCCVNPIIYCFMNDSFQKHFLDTVCCSRRSRKETSHRLSSFTEENVQMTPIASTYLSRSNTCTMAH